MKTMLTRVNEFALPNCPKKILKKQKKGLGENVKRYKS